MGAPSKESTRLPASAKPASPTLTAAPITKASDGSHAPARSRKPSTFAGFAMPLTIRPSPNTNPISKELKINMADLRR